MADTADKTRENRLRRMAQRQGLRIVKSPRRDVRALDYGRYMLVQADTGFVVTGAETGRPSMSLDNVEQWLLAD